MIFNYAISLIIRQTKAIFLVVMCSHQGARMDGEGIRNSEGHGLPSTLQATQLSKPNVDSLPESVSTVTKAVLDANPEGRPKKKTVVEMLLEESLCLQNVTKSTLLKFVLTSQILESDRQKYLSNQIPKSKIGTFNGSELVGSLIAIKDSLI